MDYTSILQIRYDSIITYPQSIELLENGGSRSKSCVSDLLLRLQSNDNDLFGKVNYRGLVTSTVAKKISKKVDLLLQISPYQSVWNPIINKSQRFKLVFITLTIPGQNELPNHREVMKYCMQPLLEWLRRKNGVTDYVWKAELHKSGQIHYHIVTNRFINHMHIKQRWNSLMDQHGLLELFAKRYNHRHPNSTDIHAAKSAREVRSYVRKYLGKSDKEDRAIDGKVWDCSTNLKSYQQWTDFIYSDNWERLREAEMNGTAKVLRSDYSTIFLVQPHLITSLLTQQQLKDYADHLKSIKLNKQLPSPAQSNSTTNQSISQSNRLNKALHTYSQLELELKLMGTGQLKSLHRGQ